MFKKFSVEENVSSTSQIKNSVQRSIQNKIVEQYPLLVDAIDAILPKKSMLLSKCQEYVTLISVDGEILFFNQRDGPWFPTLKVLHKYPSMMTVFQVDKGAIKFILGGANIMCPGFTSAGGRLPEQVVDADQPVAIYVEGKKHAIAVGLTKMSSTDIVSINKGIAVESCHYLMDGLWQIASL